MNIEELKYKGMTQCLATENKDPERYKINDPKRPELHLADINNISC